LLISAAVVKLQQTASVTQIPNLRFYNCTATQNVKIRNKI